MEEIIVRILILICSLITGWSLGCCYCEAIKPILLECRNEKKEKEVEKSQKRGEDK